MKEKLVVLIQTALDDLKANQQFKVDALPAVALTRTKEASHGDFATNIAMLLAKPLKMPPRQIAEMIVSGLPESTIISRVEIAGPGFINFHLTNDSEHDAVLEALDSGDQFGLATVGQKKRIHIEFVSANPTGPLHVGHGRGAAYGATVSNLLEAVGYTVHREYYVNDAGRQMRILALSIWLRYLSLCKCGVSLPANAYQGEYVVDIAQQLKSKHGDLFCVSSVQLEKIKPVDIDPEADKETFIDQYIENATKVLGHENFEIIRQAGIDEVTADIKADLNEFGVQYDEWFYESKLVHNGWLDAGIGLLKKQGYTYEKEGALWFRATELGDEKDRVLVRANGQPTYFASDVAYHTYKYEEGYDQIIDVFGADHHGYSARLKAFLKGLGKNPDKLMILLVQFAILYRGKEKVSMSTRSGEFVTLRELRKEVGNDAARFFYVMRKPEQHLDFDLELAKSTSNENPVYYIQYAHARICSVWRQLKTQGLVWDEALGRKQLGLLTLQEEKQLITAIANYKEVVLNAGTQYAPHKLAHFLQSFAQAFHAYYNAHKFIVEDDKLRNARLTLIKAAQQVLGNGLSLLGVSAPQEM